MAFEGWYDCVCGFQHRVGRPNPTHSVTWLTEFVAAFFPSVFDPNAYLDGVSTVKYVLVLHSFGEAKATVGPFDSEDAAEKYAVGVAGPNPDLKGRSWIVHLLQEPIVIVLV